MVHGIPSFPSAAEFMERLTYMKKIILAVLLILLLAGCSTVKLLGSGEEDSSLQDSASGSGYRGWTEAGRTGESELLPATPEDSSASVSSLTSPEDVFSSGTGTKEESAGAAADAEAQREPYDAAQAVKVEPVDGGIRVTFEQLPQTAEDLKALLSLYPQSDARHTCAFFIVSLVRYLDSVDDGHAMIDLLRGPRPMNGMDKDFIKDRLWEKTYLPRAYFEGATPENDYIPDAPWTLIVYDDPMTAQEGYLYVQVETTGADSRRRITLREKDGQYYLWEYSNVLTGIRLPALQDPWL